LPDVIYEFPRELPVMASIRPSLLSSPLTSTTESISKKKTQSKKQEELDSPSVQMNAEKATFLGRS
jgi:hypothetical protein